jgi:hypothetical protein
MSKVKTTIRTQERINLTRGVDKLMRNKKESIIRKTKNMNRTGIYLSIITLFENGLNFPMKRHRLGDWIKTIIFKFCHTFKENLTRQGCLLLPLLFNIILKFLARVIRQEKETKRIYVGNEEVKVSLFADDMILYLKDPKDFTQKHLDMIDLINTFDNVARYKINIPKL